MPVTVFVGLIVLLLHGNIVETQTTIARDQVTCEDSLILIQRDLVTKGYVTIDKVKFEIDQVQGHCDRFVL